MTKPQITKLDKIWRDKIHARDEVCQLCGGTQNLNAHHIEGRRMRCLRWDLDNGLLLCAGCHTFKTQSAHQSPLWFGKWFEEHYPKRHEKILIFGRLPINKIYSDYEIMLRRLKEEDVR
jgi:hypothetical protein